MLIRRQFAYSESLQHPIIAAIRLTQCCTQFKSPGHKILYVLYLHYNVAFTFKWKLLKQKVLTPKGLNWVQHCVSRIGVLKFFF